MSTILRIVAVAAIMAASNTSGSGQTIEQPAVLTIELDNAVIYSPDETDPSKLAQDPGPTTPAPGRKTFLFITNHADITAVNGKAAKGYWTMRTGVMSGNANPTPGQMIADTFVRGAWLCFWEILDSDGTWIGNFTSSGMTPPGRSHTIIGANGAFFGVSGEIRLQDLSSWRMASVREDPANRRLHGGAKVRATFRLYPKYRPTVDVAPAGPSVYHADFSPVTATSPARAGEVLIVAARNLGPTRPDLLPPGSRPFNAEPPEVVNSPVEATMNGKEAEVINKVGWPGTYDLYRVDLRVPSGLAPGMASIQLTAAWIPGPEVKIPVQ